MLLGLIVSCRGNIFSTLSKTQYHEVRKVCVEAILHTDNAQHFTMIKDVQMLYEVWDVLAESHRWGGSGFVVCSWFCPGFNCGDVRHPEVNRCE